MRELVDKQLMLEDVKSWVAMDSYDQHWINNMSAWIENLPTVGVSDGDCISRRVAIDALDCINGAEEVLRAFPSVQPEIIRCKDCKHRDKYGCCKYWKGLAMADIPIATDDYDFCSYAKRI